jgi:hypothetical protein
MGHSAPARRASHSNVVRLGAARLRFSPCRAARGRRATHREPVGALRARVYLARQPAFGVKPTTLLAVWLTAFLLCLGVWLGVYLAAGSPSPW